MKEKIIATREYREKLLCDPYRPTFHFAFPDDNGYPGDSNGAFFADGVYHLMYLYQNSKDNAYCWGHISSIDLLHWRHYPDALVSDEGDEGCFSGGAFLDDDKTAYLSFWKFPSKKEGGDKGGIALAFSKPPYEKWERMEPVAVEGSGEIWGTLDIEVNGKTEHISCADPSNIWKQNGYYYMQLGNKCVLDAFGREENSEERYQGDWTDLFRSKYLKNWSFVHRFYENDRRGIEDFPDKTEDDMCPSFLPLFDAKENGNFTGKWLQLFISHNKGCQYYIGELKDEKFILEKHGRMTFKDNAFFAPEALVDSKNRHIAWTWLLDNPKNDFERFSWSGVYSLPRVLWYENDELKMAPANEVDSLEYNKKSVTVNENNSIAVNNGEVFRLKAVIDTSKEDAKAGFIIRKDENNGEKTEIYYDAKSATLVFDSRESGKDGFMIKEEASLKLSEGEKLKLDIFVDKSVIEIFANEKQAICRRVYPSDPKNAVGVEFLGNKESLISLAVSDIFPSNPY